ncbi:MAG: basic secretory family protein, partial [Planctomycetaceae bacterium]|nr:basic secretory family protein [Planctomycetaceae bacterium]
MDVPTDQKVKCQESLRPPVRHLEHLQRRPAAVLLTLIVSMLALIGCSESRRPAASTPVDEEVIVVASDTADASEDVPQPPAHSEANTRTEPQRATAPAHAKSQPQIAETVTGPRRRLPDDRPDINEQRLQAAGIRVERGRRLILLTDLPPQETAGLCQLADRLFDKLERDLGPLPPAADSSEFQVTGHLIGDASRFASIGLMPGAALTFRHGRHVNYRFWMNNPDTAYYRRHLLLHEFTHCFMTCESGMTDIPPLWYIEGMAEYFATHRLEVDGSVTFAVMPGSYEGFEGWGRVSELQRVAGLDAESIGSDQPPQIPRIHQVMRESVNSQQDVDYAWWWAVCWMLQNHPQYAEDFAEFRTRQQRAPFLQTARSFLQQHKSTLAVDWLLFVESLESGFRSEREFSRIPADRWTLNSEKSRSLTIRPDAGWTSTGLQMQAGEQVQITAQGRYAMNQP